MSSKKKTAVKESVATTLPPTEGATKGQELTVVSEHLKAELSFIERMLTNPRADVKKLRELLTMRKEARADEARMSYNRAMRDCQMELPAVVRETENKHTKSFYAKLESVHEACSPIWLKHGFSLSFDSRTMPNGEIKVLCDVAHIDGHVEHRELQAELDVGGMRGKENKTRVQGVTSSTTTLRRVLTTLIFNIALKDMDKDGNRPGGPVVKTNSFDDAVKGGRSSEASYEEVEEEEDEEWDGRTVILASSEVKNEWANAETAGAYLKKALSGIKKADHRRHVVNLNLPLLRSLVKAGKQSVVEEIHATADKEGA